MPARVIVVTGGYGVLGSALAAAALERGLSVAVIGHSRRGQGDARIFAIGGIDLTDPAQASQAMEQIAAHFGRIDILANVAGGFIWQTTEAGDPTAWERMHGLNLKTALNASRAALPHLKTSDAGRIINIGAAGALEAGAGMGAYAASKAGVHALTQALAEELKATAVTVNAVLPSILDTPQNRADMPKADPGQWVAPADLASVILFLASPESRAVTGALIPVTGKV